jgi:hypothetical protein
MIARATILVCALFAAAAGCSGTARGLEAYRTDTQRLLATRNDQLKGCYDAALKSDPKASGTVTVTFVVEKKTGAIANAAIDTAKTSAPQPVSACVLKAVDGLKLDPADRHEGRATFVYEFTPATSAAS